MLQNDLLRYTIAFVLIGIAVWMFLKASRFLRPGGKTFAGLFPWPHGRNNPYLGMNGRQRLIFSLKIASLEIGAAVLSAMGVFLLAVSQQESGELIGRMLICLVSLFIIGSVITTVNLYLTSYTLEKKA